MVNRLILQIGLRLQVLHEHNLQILSRSLFSSLSFVFSKERMRTIRNRTAYISFWEMLSPYFLFSFFSSV